MKNLTIGLVPTEKTVYDELLMEMLDHQGIIYEVVVGDTVKKYPVVLTSEASDSSRRLASNASASQESMLVAEDVVDLAGVLKYLSGLVEEKMDHFNLSVNEAELRLTAAVKQALSSQDLPLVQKWFWPGMAKACCVLTHDIDWLSYSPFHKAVVGGGSPIPRVVGLALNGLFGRRDYGWNIPETAELEKKYGVRSTSFFRTEYQDPGSRLAQSIDLLRSGGFEIGLHAANSSHSSAAALESELELFRGFAGGNPRGIRHHILKLKLPDTWIIEEEAGLEYDATLAHNRFFGFRGGICLPFHPFGQRRLPIVELPTSFMDWTALHQGLRGSRATIVLTRIREMVERFHGALVVNFHNTYLNRDTFPDVFEVYESLLATVRSEGYWVATAKECADWWRLRTSAQVDPLLDDSGRVTCSGSEVPIVVSYHDGDPVPLHGGSPTLPERAVAISDSVKE